MPKRGEHCKMKFLYGNLNVVANNSAGRNHAFMKLINLIKMKFIKKKASLTLTFLPWALVLWTKILRHGTLPGCQCRFYA